MLRTRATIAVGKAARAAARLRGGGSALPGLVVERLDPGFLTRMLADLPGGVVVVSGTNGKTTTTKMLVAVLRAHGRRVFTNPTGSNFTRGVISSMLGVLPASGRLDADTAVLELDEAHALRFADAVPPTHALLLNVARDQLDRFAEIDATAALLRRLAEQVRTAVVLNHDDSFVARIRPSIPAGVQVRWFGIDPALVDGLPSLYEADVRDDAGVEPEPLASGDAMLRPRL
ncbi:MAG TPA: Mur ligase family protein, partial [Dermatophilaceae bacterium]|nr:Mur ligase family protein [Dermatophilaceae bacterium]